MGDLVLVKLDFVRRAIGVYMRNTPTKELNPLNDQYFFAYWHDILIDGCVVSIHEDLILVTFSLDAAGNTVLVNHDEL